nr:uncharacterized protein LOC129014587 [Pongo pygmaeus]
MQGQECHNPTIKCRSDKKFADQISLDMQHLGSGIEIQVRDTEEYSLDPSQVWEHMKSKAQFRVTLCVRHRALSPPLGAPTTNPFVFPDQASPSQLHGPSSMLTALLISASVSFSSRPVSAKQEDKRDCGKRESPEEPRRASLPLWLRPRSSPFAIGLTRGGGSPASARPSGRERRRDRGRGLSQRLLGGCVRKPAGRGGPAQRVRPENWEEAGEKMPSESFCLAAQARLDSKWLQTDIQMIVLNKVEQRKKIWMTERRKMKKKLLHLYIAPSEFWTAGYGASNQM